jgi:hypothetical protein
MTPACRNPIQTGLSGRARAWGGSDSHAWSPSGRRPARSRRRDPRAQRRQLPPQRPLPRTHPQRLTRTPELLRLSPTGRRLRSTRETRQGVNFQPAHRGQFSSGLDTLTASRTPSPLWGFPPKDRLADLAAASRATTRNRAKARAYEDAAGDIGWECRTADADLHPVPARGGGAHRADRAFAMMPHVTVPEMDDGVDDLFDQSYARLYAPLLADERSRAEAVAAARLAVVPEHVVHPVLLGGWWFSRPQHHQGVPDEVAR